MAQEESIIKKALNKYCDEVNKYYKAGNVESSYNKPVIDLIQTFSCTAHDFSGARSGENGENIDIKLWHIDEDINKIPPFGAIEVKKIDGKDTRAKEQIIVESKKYGNVILTDNATWEFYHADSEKMYNGFRLLVKNEKLFEELKQTLNPKQKSMLEKYSDNCMDLVNVEIDELTKYILKDFEEDR